MEGTLVSSQHIRVLTPPAVVHFFLLMPERLALPDGWEETMVSFLPPDQAEHVPPPDDAPPAAPGQVIDHTGDRVFQCRLRHYIGAHVSQSVRDLKATARVAERIGFPGGAERIPEHSRPRIDPPETDASVVQVSVPCSPGANREELLAALQIAVQYVQDLQRSYYHAVQDPVSLVTLERLPAFVRYVITETSSYQAPSVDSLHGNVVANGALAVNLHSLVGQPGRDFEATSASIASDFRMLDEGDQFFSFLEFRREATTSLEILGDYRGAVVWSACAAESLLDEILQAMLWEESVRPEDAVGEFLDQAGGITARVKSKYGARLGGAWNIGDNASGPIADWFAKVANVRNRVVHGRYGPSRVDAADALSALNGLVTFLCDRFADRTRDYPRTAWMLLGGRGGFERRGRRVPRRIVELLEDTSEVRWSETLFRWRESNARCRRDAEARRVPDLTRAHRYVVMCPGGGEYLCFHDRVTAQASKAAFSFDQMIDGHRESFMQALPLIRSRMRDTHLSTGFPSSVFPSAVPTTDWVEEYRLVPMAGVMVDGSDLDDAC